MEDGDPFIRVAMDGREPSDADATANLNVVDDHTSVGVTSDGTGALSDALEGTIGRGLEIKGGRPVVRLSQNIKNEIRDIQHFCITNLVLLD